MINWINLVFCSALPPTDDAYVVLFFFYLLNSGGDQHLLIPHFSFYRYL